FRKRQTPEAESHHHHGWAALHAPADPAPEPRRGAQAIHRRDHVPHRGPPARKISRRIRGASALERIAHHQITEEIGVENEHRFTVPGRMEETLRTHGAYQRT